MRFWKEKEVFFHIGQRQSFHQSEKIDFLKKKAKQQAEIK